MAKTTATAAKTRWIACFERHAAIRRRRRGSFSIAFGEVDPPKIDITILRRGRCCRRRSGRAKIELHRRWPFRARLGSEEGVRRKTKHACNQICREAAHRHIVVWHRAGELTALDLS